MPIRFLSSFLILSRPTDQKIELLMNQFKLTKEQVEMCIQADPSPNQTDFVTWVARMLSKGHIRLPEDGQGIRENLTTFQVQRRQPGFGGSKDVNTYQNPAMLAETIQQNALTVVRPKDLEKIKGLQGVTPAVQKGDITIFRVTNPEALMSLSDSTDWCTRHEGNATTYLAQGPSFVAFYKGKPYAQLHPASDQFKDRFDSEFAKEYYEEGHTERRYVGWGRHRDTTVRGPLIGSAISDPVALEMMNLLRKADPEVEAYAQKQNYADPAVLVKRLKGTKHWIDAAVMEGVPLSPEEESALGTQDPKTLKPYADKFHPRGRWAPLEQAILAHLKEWKGMTRAIDYASERIKGRWPELEPTILHDAPYDSEKANRALAYAVGAVRGRWPELEKKFFQSKSIIVMPRLAARYAIEVLKRPWRDVLPQAMFQYGMTNIEFLMCKYVPDEAIKYAEALNLKPWPQLAETLLRQHNYAGYISYLEKIGGKERDPKLEKMILSPKPETWQEDVPLTRHERRSWYWDHHNKPEQDHPPETKTVMYSLDKDAVGNEYAEKVVGQRWPEFEQRLLGELMVKERGGFPTEFSGLTGRHYDNKLPDPWEPYLMGVVKGRWLEMEAVLLQRYRTFPEEWETNQALVQGYLRATRELATGKKEVEYDENFNRMPSSLVQGIWSEGEKMLSQRSPAYEEGLKKDIDGGYREFRKSKMEMDQGKASYLRDASLWAAGRDLKQYILFLRSLGNDWPEGVDMLNGAEDFRESESPEDYSLKNRLASHALLRARRMEKL